MRAIFHRSGVYKQSPIPIELSNRFCSHPHQQASAEHTHTPTSIHLISAASHRHAVLRLHHSAPGPGKQRSDQQTSLSSVRLMRSCIRSNAQHRAYLFSHRLHFTTATLMLMLSCRVYVCSHHFRLRALLLRQRSARRSDCR